MFKPFQIFFFLVITISSFCQPPQTIYYDSDWMVTTSSNATYYREIRFDKNDKPLGEVRDYYTTGELQWVGKLSYFDDRDNSKDIAEGLSTWYYKNGNKSRESHLIENIENGLTVYWYENGNKWREINYSKGKPDGDWIDYHESGKIYRIFNFTSGEFREKFYTECDEFGTCEKVFHEGFLNEYNSYGWPLVKEKTFNSTIVAEKGLEMQTYEDSGFRQTIRIPLNLEDDFSIETIIDFKSGSINTGQGLIWGFKDWDNYYFFNISANGYFRIGGVSEGINLEFVEWTESDVINQKSSRNSIKILKIEDKYLFSINGTLVHSNDFYGFRGNEIGFSISSGEKLILFEHLTIKQQLSAKEILAGKNEGTNSSSSWNGNGSGFFIDTRGIIVTNYHVVEGASEIEIEFTRNGIIENYQTEIIQSDPRNDISILKIKSKSFKSFQNIPYNFKTKISETGSSVFALGYPMALSLMGKQIKFTDGKISSITGFKGDISSYQISVPIQPGNSGGPLFDYDGNLIAITSAGINRDLGVENVNYAIKASYIRNLIDVLPMKIELPMNTQISSLPLIEKIRILSEYVVLIKVR